MKLKTITVHVDGKDIVVAALDDKGLPIYVHDDGKEIGFDAPQAAAKIAALNAEARNHREAKEAAETKLKTFEGIDDPEAARTALQTVANLDEGQLVTAGKVDEVKRSVETALEAKYAGKIKGLETQVAELTTDRDGLRTSLDSEVIGGAFGRSKYLAEKTILPPEVAEAYFRPHFRIEDGKLVARDKEGVVIHSRQNTGNPADFEEAIETIVEAYPRKGNILKGTGANGSGAAGSSGGSAGAKTMTRAQFDGLSQADRIAKVKDGFKVVD